METTFETDLCRTKAIVNNEDINYETFYDSKRDKCYYKANDEYLMIIEKNKVVEVKKSYNEQLKAFWLKVASISLTALALGFAGYKYYQSRQPHKKIKLKGKYQSL